MIGSRAVASPGWPRRTALLATLLAYADERGFARVVLGPSERSVPFYGRAGFGPADTLLLRPGD